MLVIHDYLEQLLLMSLIGLKVLGDWHAGIPVSFSEPQMIRVNEVFDFLLDGSGIDRNVVFGKELFLSVVVEFIVFDWTDFWCFLFLNVEQVGDLLLLFFESSLVGLFDDHELEIKFYFYYVVWVS